MARMKTKFIRPLLAGLAIVAAGFLPTRILAAEGHAESQSLSALAREATSTDPARSAAAIKELRAAGADGLRALSEGYSNQIAGHALQVRADKIAATDQNWERIRAAFDAVGEQRDCCASQLYWFTDLDQAEAAAHAAGKPILSLRLLGKLDEEYSCANSRFFRTTLYANAEVSAYLREHFILHWQSVRPVPRITIDMGDGRKIERTITGNSIHYILDAGGNPIDALPGLYGAKAFLDGLNRAENAEQQSSKLNGNEREAFLKNYHETRLAEIQQQWTRDLAQVGGVGITVPGVNVINPDAIKAGKLAIGKGLVEMPVLRSSQPGSALSGASSYVIPTVPINPDASTAASRAVSKLILEQPMLRAGAQPATASRIVTDGISDATWQAIAQLYAGDAKLDAGAYNLIASKQPKPTMAEAMRLTSSKTIVETPMMRMVRNLEHSIAEDTVRNEYQFHARIHEWLAAGGANQNLAAFNQRVYAELFLTPDSDPWLGLAPADTFSALDNGGLVQNSTQH